MTWMQRVRDGRLFKRARWRCWFHHRWATYQHSLTTSDGGATFVIAWKQCQRCARSKLIHILE